MRISSQILALALASIVIVQCDDIGAPESSETRLARVGSNYLTLNEARTAIAPFLLKEDSIQALKNYREQWIREQLLLGEANKLQLSQQESVQKKLFNARKEILKNALQEAIITDFTNKVNLSDQEIRSYFEQNKEQLILPERYVQFRHLETSSLSSARKAREQLQDNISWQEVARNYSQNAEQKIRNANKFWPESTVLVDVPIMKRYITTLDSGAVSPIQRFNGIYHMVQRVDERLKGDYADPQWFTNELKQWLLIEKQRKHYDSYVKNLYLNARKDNEIDVYNVMESDTVNPDKIESNQPNE